MLISGKQVPSVFLPKNKTEKKIPKIQNSLFFPVLGNWTVIETFFYKMIFISKTSRGGKRAREWIISPEIRFAVFCPLCVMPSICDSFLLWTFSFVAGTLFLIALASSDKHWILNPPKDLWPLMSKPRFQSLCLASVSMWSWATLQMVPMVGTVGLLLPSNQKVRLSFSWFSFGDILDSTL